MQLTFDFKVGSSCPQNGFFHENQNVQKKCQNLFFIRKDKTISRKKPQLQIDNSEFVEKKIARPSDDNKPAKCDPPIFGYFLCTFCRKKR